LAAVVRGKRTAAVGRDGELVQEIPGDVERRRGRRRAGEQREALRVFGGHRERHVVRDAVGGRGERLRTKLPTRRRAVEG